MVNTRTDADLFAAVQNALQTLLPRIREEIREEFRTGSRSSNAGVLEEGVSFHSSDKDRDLHGVHEALPSTCWIPRGRGVVIGISRPLSRVVTEVTVKITTVMDLTGVVVVITTAAATTTTLAVTTG
uniref:Zinc finger, CCHC-type, retrotransposon Gag domain protein n=1 Tax=Tanacetum cinerariifolium TaxID=118510 RepID=A0A699S2H8_TANCI|nr:hypothetical protein [Tanacetum cinerariifolium]